jgi:protein-S-isoprenylcysteine O-methyltransferase Ste14
MLSLRIPPPIWMLLAGAMMWSLDRFSPVLTVVAAPWNRAGWYVMAVALLPALAAITQFVRARTTINPHDPNKTSALVTGGIYRWSRNPMYLGLLVLLLGWAIRLGSLTPFLIPPLFALLLQQVQIAPEERLLRARFGDDYERYCQRVGRWLGPGQEPPAKRR